MYDRRVLYSWFQFSFTILNLHILHVKKSSYFWRKILLYLWLTFDKSLKFFEKFIIDEYFFRISLLCSCIQKKNWLSSQVKKTIPECGHNASMECSVAPTPERCNAKCERLAPCGHPCKSMCRKPCGTEKCMAVVKVRDDRALCGHQYIYSFCYQNDEGNYAGFSIGTCVLSLDKGLRNFLISVYKWRGCHLCISLYSFIFLNAVTPPFSASNSAWERE